MIELVCRSANRWQGRRQGKAEALEHAKCMMTHYNMSIEELAKNFFLPVKPCGTGSRRKSACGRRSSPYNVPTSNLSDSQIVALGRLAFNQKLLGRAAAVAQEYRLKLEDTKALADRAKAESQNGEQAGLNAIFEICAGPQGDQAQGPGKHRCRPAAYEFPVLYAPQRLSQLHQLRKQGPDL